MAYRVPAKAGAPLSVTFQRRNGAVDLPRVALPCGRCIGCRIDRAKEWTLRCTHESKLHDSNLFLTFTYDPDHLPPDRSVNKRDMQLIIKLMRRYFGKFRYYLCAEYGDENQRPHYHMLAFGLDLPDLKILSRRKGIYNQDKLTQLWAKGFVTVQRCNAKTIAYTARYVLKKKFGSNSVNEAVRERANAHYKGLTPEFTMMSLKPAIGKLWSEKYADDYLNKGYLTVNFSKAAIPKYYMKNLELTKPEVIANLKARRRAAFKPEDNTPDRLEQREVCAKAKTAARPARSYEGGFVIK